VQSGLSLPVLAFIPFVIFVTRVPFLLAGYCPGGCRRTDCSRRPEAKYLTGAEGLPGLGTYCNICAISARRSGSRWLNIMPDLGCNRAIIPYIVADYSTSGRLGFLLPCIPPFYSLRLLVPGFPPPVWEEGCLGIFVIGLCRIYWIPFNVIVLLVGTSRCLSP